MSKTVSVFTTSSVDANFQQSKKKFDAILKSANSQNIRTTRSQFLNVEYSPSGVYSESISYKYEIFGSLDVDSVRIDNAGNLLAPIQFYESDEIIDPGTSNSASAISFTPTGGVTSSNVQDAIEELDAEKQRIISYGSTSDYFGGDHTWRTLNKTAVGLGLVDNTPDASKEVLTSTRLKNPRNISISGAITGTAAFDGSSDIIINTTLNASTAITNINVSGHVTKTGSASEPTISVVGSSANSPTTLVERDVSGNFSANSITVSSIQIDNTQLGSVSLTTNSTTATQLIAFSALLYGSMEILIHAKTIDDINNTKLLICVSQANVKSTEYGSLWITEKLFTTQAVREGDSVKVIVTPLFNTEMQFDASYSII